MNFPALTTHEKTQKELILVVDKIGVIGEELARQLSQDFLIVLLSPNPAVGNERIIHVPFKKRIPKAPDNRYSKIFIVDDGNSITRQSAFSFIEKARQSDSPLFFIGSIRNVDVAHADQITASYSNSKVLIFGDLFDKNIFFGEEASINKFILQARKTGKILVDGNGLSLSFPITFTDTIKLIIKASYLEIAQKVILLFYPHPITDISLANTFQKINPDIKVDFVKGKREREIYMPQGGQHAISKYDLEGKIRELRLEDTENRPLKIISKDSSRRSFLKPFLAIFLIFLFIVLLPFLTTSAYVLLGQREIKNARVSASQGGFDRAKKQVNNSKTFFEIALKTSEPLIWEANLLGMGESAKRIRNKAQGGAMVSLAGTYLFDGAYLIRDIYSGKSKDPKNDFSKASNSLKSAVALIQKTKAEGNLPKELEEEIDNITPFIDLFSNSSDVLPDILGFEKEKSYLVLFQDETKLRPGGGTTSSFAILKVRQAKIVELGIFNSSWLDERIDTTIEPPFMLRRYLSLDSLDLANSNTDPDFINSAINATNIYSLGTKEKVDGVIALDLTFLKNLLSEIGPVRVSNEKITQSNLFEAHLEQSSLGKGDFIALVTKALKEDLERRKDIPYFALSKQVGKSIMQKHLLFASPIPSYQNIFTANGWSSSLWDNRDKENNKINDYLGIVEANLGSNNVNYYVSRSVSKKIILDSGKLSSTLTIGFKNNSNQKKNGGNYKNYLQLILPESTKINSIAIDGEKVKIEKAITNPMLYESSNFKPPAGFEVEERNQMDKSIFGFLLIVPSSQVRTLSIVYDLPYTLPPVKKSIIYSLKLYKQPGIDSYPFDLTFELPENYHVIGNDNFSEEIKNDKELSFIIAQK